MAARLVGQSAAHPLLKYIYLYILTWSTDLSPLRACLRGLGGYICFQWVPAHCGLLRNERADEEARKAANLGPADGAHRGRISFEVVKRLIRSQVKDGPPNHAPTVQVYGDGPFRPFQDASRREEVLLAQLRGGRSLLLG
jgi:hypothetical protein